jgi:uncharacterized protein YbbC (DUF1343 family)
MAGLVAAGEPRVGEVAWRPEVVPLSGWRREMTWADTGLTWVPPSPNLRTAEAALAYPGTCLLEATNVTEGRGTETPFLLIGAPWLRLEALIGRIPRAAGFRLEAVRFTPRSSPGARDPKYDGVAPASIHRWRREPVPTGSA